MRERIVERTFSGYRLNLPQQLKLFARDIVTGEYIELIDSRYWAMKPIWEVFKELTRN